MKRLFIILTSSALPLLSIARPVEPSDSASVILDEVVVQGLSTIETAKKVILYPTSQDKKHSSNGYKLLANINLPDIAVDADAKTISMITGQSVQILINGVEAQADELSTLPASEILRIDYQRNPGGKYIGSGAVMNFITRQYDYGGNVYLSAEEGVLHQYGNYTANVNFKRNAVTLAFTANGQWRRTSELNSAVNLFTLNSGALEQNVSPRKSLTRTDSEYARFKFSHAADNHSFDVSLSLTRSAVPDRYFNDIITYKGVYDFTAASRRQSDERGLSPSLNINYNLYMPNRTVLSFAGTAAYGHSTFNSRHSETGQADILNNTVEDNFSWSATASWFKDMPHGITVGASIDNIYNRYRDTYSGSFNSRQTLTNNLFAVDWHWQQTLPAGLYYYLSAGLSNLYSEIGHVRDNQTTPTAYYGISYTPDRRHTFSLTGNYLHSVYNPSYKNDAVIRTSFFQANVGNPDLGQMKALQNMVSYNGRFGAFGLSATYDFMKYFDNTAPEYFVSDDIVYNRLINDGNFLNHRFIVGASVNLLHDRLKLNANATYSLYRFNSLSRPERSNNLRFSSNASFMFGDWQVKGVWSPAFRGTDIQGERFRMSAQYGIILNWSHGNWTAECTVKNFLHKYRAIDRTIAHDCYHSVSRSLSDAIGRNVCLTVTYSLPYGKKTDREKATPKTTVNSAILRPF